MAVDPPERLSPSSLLTLEQCSLKFRYSKIDKLPEESGIEAMLGNFVHDALECMYGMPANTRTLEGMRGILSGLWEDEWGPKIKKVVSGEKNLREVRWKAWWAVENLFELEDPTSIIPAGLETHVEGEIDGVKIHGYVDRWGPTSDGSMAITDYKTGKTPAKRYRGDKFFQLQVYADLVRDTQGVALEKLELLYLKSGDRLIQEISEEHQDKMRAKVVESRRKLEQLCETEGFEPNPTRLCDWCSFKSICPAHN